MFVDFTVSERIHSWTISYNNTTDADGLVSQVSGVTPGMITTD